MLDTRPLLLLSNFPSLSRHLLETLQVNLGYLCNLSCTHCHVGASPQRTELMDAETVQTVLRFIAARQIQTLDLTGGAPELNPHFRDLVCEARARGVKVIDRCNLTILNEPGQEDLADFLAAQQVEVVASLPCYAEQNVDKQRGKGVYAESITGLKKLNALGYGLPDSGLALHLVFNPGGPHLPPEQHALEADYKRELQARHGIHFNQLYVLTNMPIMRFGSMLLSQGRFHEYMDLLKSAYQAQNLDSLMCRSMLSVDWRGRIYDCDFNQMLDLPVIASDRERPTLQDVLAHPGFLADSPIRVADHCYGCTAGQGSSCGGAL